MSDSWKNLADLLGTPSIDPPESKKQDWPSAKKEVAAPTPEFGESRDTPVAPAPQSQAASPSRKSEPKAAAADPKESKGKFKSTWDAVAVFLGVTASVANGDDLTEEEPQLRKRDAARSDEADDSEEASGFFSARLSEPAGAETAKSSNTPSSSTEDPDLDVLLAGFRSPEQPAAPERSSVDSGAAPAGRGDRRGRSEDRGPRRERSPRGEGGRDRGRSRSDEPRTQGPRSEGPRSEGPRGEGPRGDAARIERPRGDGTRDEGFRDESPRGRREPAPRPAAGFGEGVSTAADADADEGVPQRRSVRRRSRREMAMMKDREQPVDSIVHDDLPPPAESFQEERPSRSRRRPRRDDDLPIATEDSVDPQTAFADDLAIASDEPDGDRTRRRRRRRRSRDEEDSTEETASSGRQIYGRQMEDDLPMAEDVSVVSWVEAVSPIVDRNIDRHRDSRPQRR